MGKLSKEIYEKAHKEFPHNKMYPNKPEKCIHSFSFTIYCNGDTDIVRCLKCGMEKEVRCNFDDDYD